MVLWGKQTFERWISRCLSIWVLRTFLQNLSSDRKKLLGHIFLNRWNIKDLKVKEKYSLNTIIAVLLLLRCIYNVQFIVLWYRCIEEGPDLKWWISLQVPRLWVRAPWTLQQMQKSARKYFKELRKIHHFLTSVRYRVNHQLKIVQFHYWNARHSLWWCHTAVKLSFCQLL